MNNTQNKSEEELEETPQQEENNTTNPEDNQSAKTDEGGVDSTDGQESTSQTSESESEKRARQLQEERDNIRNELIAMREERRELRQKVEQYESNNSGGNQATDNQADVTQVVESLLQQKEQERAKQNRRKAFEKFVIDHKEYHPENDSTGLKRERLENEFSKFNLNGVTETEDFYDFIKKANTLINPSGSTERKTVNPYPTDPSSTSADQDVRDPYALTKEEKNLAQKTGWTEEKLKDLKKKDPEYLETLLY